MNKSSCKEILDYRNPSGHGWIFYKCDDVLRPLAPDITPQDDMKLIQKVRNFELRDDDVLIAAYPKCGTHWLFEIVTMILSGRVEYSTHQKEGSMLGIPYFGKADSLPSPRVLNSHYYYRHLPEKLEEKKIKTIHMIRNPKDVSVSFYHHMKGMKAPIGFEGTFAEFFDLYLKGEAVGINIHLSDKLPSNKVRCGSFFDHIKDWQQVEKDHPDLPFLNLYYEELKKKPLKVIHDVANFLDKPISDVLCREIAEACGFKQLKVADALKEDCVKGGWAEMWTEGRVKIYRKGEVGDWKNWLTVAQNERIDVVIEREIKGTGIKFTYD